jgi:hypothetical protein
MRPRVGIVLGVAAIACGATAWQLIRSRSKSSVHETPSLRREADAPSSASAVAPGGDSDGTVGGPEDKVGGKVGGMERASYDALARRTWQLLNRGDAGPLARELAEGRSRSLDDIKDANLRSLVSAKLGETDDAYARAKQATSKIEEAAVQKKIDARNYSPVKKGSDVGPEEERGHGKRILLTAWRALPDRTRIYVRVFEEDAPGLEESRREMKSIEDRRVEEVTQIFKDHGLAIAWPLKQEPR